MAVPNIQLPFSRNYNFALLPDAENTFGTCAMKIQGHRVEPPGVWECARAQRIEAIQGNENAAVKHQCLELGLW